MSVSGTHNKGTPGGQVYQSHNTAIDYHQNKRLLAYRCAGLSDLVLFLQRKDRHSVNVFRSQVYHRDHAQKIFLLRKLLGADTVRPSRPHDQYTKKYRKQSSREVGKNSLGEHSQVRNSPFQRQTFGIVPVSISGCLDDSEHGMSRRKEAPHLARRTSARWAKAERYGLPAQGRLGCLASSFCRSRNATLLCLFADNLSSFETGIL